MPPRSKRQRTNTAYQKTPYSIHPAVTPGSPSPVVTTTRHFTARKFRDAPISNASKAGIKHEFMTDVQDATFDLALSGKDILVQAKTGTGKTMAFLLPTVERLCKLPNALSSHAISVLVLSPTRELACQIEDEANVLLQHHDLKVQHAIGGTNINTEQNRIHNQRCDILVATPGRLIDLLENYHILPKFSNLKTLIFDEADRLLDAGFRRELQKIVEMLPNPVRVPRQVMLFSATISAEIKQVAALALRSDYKFISTLLEEEVNTHEHVEQSYLIAPFVDSLPTTLAILREDQSTHRLTSKCMVFFPTARSTAIAAETLRRIHGLPSLLEIHSRMSQPARTRAANSFKDAKSAILLSSDVAARGMDFPGVTLVLQVGLPANGEQYIHRLGRTARAGASGRGIVILSPHEQFFLRSRDVRDLPIKLHKGISSPLIVHKADIIAALDDVDNEPKASAYQAWMGYYKGYLRDMQWSPAELVEQANEYAFQALRYKTVDGMPPPILAKTVGKMGIRGTKGLNVVSCLPGKEGRAPSGVSGRGLSRGHGSTGGERQNVSGASVDQKVPLHRIPGGRGRTQKSPF